jgi:hypothetical protein
MMTRRLSTPLPESPVRFYRIIAVSFLVITVSLLSVVLYMTTKRATVTVIAKEEKATFSVNAPLQEAADPGAVQGSVVLTPFAFSKTYNPVGTKTIEGTSHGMITIFNKTDQALALIPKTRFLTASGTLFRLPKRVDVPAGSQVDAEVFADQPGGASDIGPSQFVLPALASGVQSSVYAVSSQPMSGGSKQVGVISAEDITAAQTDFAEKVKEEFLARGVGANLPANLKIIVGVQSTNSAADHRAGEEAASFTVTGTSTLLVVTYHTDDVQRLLEQEIRNRVQKDSIKVLSVSAEGPVVNVVSNDSAAKTAQLVITEDATVTLDEGSSHLSPENFVGKTKADIESYVNALQYVAGTEVKFSPQFLMRTAPSLSDKIKVIVKNIK